MSEFLPSTFCCSASASSSSLVTSVIELPFNSSLSVPISTVSSIRLSRLSISTFSDIIILFLTKSLIRLVSFMGRTVSLVVYVPSGLIGYKLSFKLFFKITFKLGFTKYELEDFSLITAVSVCVRAPLSIFVIELLMTVLLTSIGSTLVGIFSFFTSFIFGLLSCMSRVAIISVFSFSLVDIAFVVIGEFFLSSVIISVYLLSSVAAVDLMSPADGADDDDNFLTCASL